MVTNTSLLLFYSINATELIGRLVKAKKKAATTMHKIFAKNKSVKQNYTRTESSEIYFCVICDCDCQIVISRGENEH